MTETTLLHNLGTLCIETTGDLDRWDRWDRLQPPRDPTNGLSGYRKWMDGCIETTEPFSFCLQHFI